MPKSKGIPEAMLNRPYSSSVTLSIPSYATRSVDIGPTVMSKAKEWRLRELGIYPVSISCIYRSKKKRLGTSYIWGIGPNENTTLNSSMADLFQNTYTKPHEFPSWTKVTVAVTNSTTTNPGSAHIDWLWDEW